MLMNVFNFCTVISVQFLLLALAYYERGYYGFGGEWLVLPAWFLLRHLTREHEKQQDKLERVRGGRHASKF